MTNKNLIKKLKLELLKHKNPEMYGKKLFGKNSRYCRYQGCNECYNTGGIVHSSHDFAGPLGPYSFR